MMRQNSGNKPITPIDHKVEVASSGSDRNHQRSIGESENNKENDSPHPHKEGGQSENGDNQAKGQDYYKQLQKEKLEKELTHLGKNTWFTKVIINYTWVILLATIIFTLIMTVLCIVLGGFSLSEEHERTYMIWEDHKMKDWDMLELSKEAVQTNYAGGIQPLRTTSIDKWTTSITFECKNCSTILTADYIKEMYAVEQAIISDTNFANFCLAVSSTDSSCDMSRSYYSFAKNFASNIEGVLY